MTDDMMNLRALMEKSPDADLREVIGYGAQSLMELEVGGTHTASDGCARGAAGRPKRPAEDPLPPRGRKGQRRTATAPVLAIVQRYGDLDIGSPAGDARASVVGNLSLFEAARILEREVDLGAH